MNPDPKHQNQKWQFMTELVPLYFVGCETVSSSDRTKEMIQIRPAEVLHEYSISSPKNAKCSHYQLHGTFYGDSQQTRALALAG